MPGLVDPSKLVFGEPTHQMATASGIPTHKASECDTYPRCPFGRTERERKVFMDQIEKSAAAYWKRLTERYEYVNTADRSDDPNKIAGRVEDFLGFMFAWQDEDSLHPISQSLRDLYQRDGYATEPGNWPVIMHPTSEFSSYGSTAAGDAAAHPVEASPATSEEVTEKYGDCDYCRARNETLHRNLAGAWVCSRHVH